MADGPLPVGDAVLYAGTAAIFAGSLAEGIGDIRQQRSYMQKVQCEGTDGDAEDVSKEGIVDTPETNPDEFVKLKGDQGYRDQKGNTWKKDKLHKDHWDVSNKKGKKVKEVDYEGREIWPNGPKNKNK